MKPTNDYLWLMIFCCAVRLIRSFLDCGRKDAALDAGMTARCAMLQWRSLNASTLEALGSLP